MSRRPPGLAFAVVDAIRGLLCPGVGSLFADVALSTRVILALAVALGLAWWFVVSQGGEEASDKVCLIKAVPVSVGTPKEDPQ